MMKPPLTPFDPKAWTEYSSGNNPGDHHLRHPHHALHLRGERHGLDWVVYEEQPNRMMGRIPYQPSLITALNTACGIEAARIEQQWVRFWRDWLIKQQAPQGRWLLDTINALWLRVPSVLEGYPLADQEITVGKAQLREFCTAVAPYSKIQEWPAQRLVPIFHTMDLLVPTSAHARVRALKDGDSLQNNSLTED